MLNRISRYFAGFSPDMAVDLGTANTLVSVVGEGLVVNEPSVVALDRATGRILSGGCAVGRLAKQLLGRTPDSIRVVRPLSEGVISDFQLCEAMLRYFMRKAQHRGVALRPRVLVAAPGCITPVQKRALFNSAQRAGARQVYVLPEAKAAAIGVGLPIIEPVASMVCDVGGGTTEVAVMSLGDIVASQSARVGGDAMDAAIVDYLRRCYSLSIGPQAAERLRIEIGIAYPLSEEQSQEVCGVDTISGLPRRAQLTSEEIREALADPLAAIIDAVKTTIDGCPAELAADLVDRGMVLTGGAAQLRGMDRYVQEQTGLPTRVDDDPLTSVASGARICLEQFSRWRDAMQSADEEMRVEG